MIMTILIIFNILTVNLQNVPATPSQSTQEMKKSNLKSQNGELDYKKVNNKQLMIPTMIFYVNLLLALGGITKREFQTEVGDEFN